MKNKMIGILVCILLVATAFPIAGAMNIQNALKQVTNDPVPDLSCKGEIVKKVVKSGSTVTGSFKVENIGKPGSLLDWEVATWPDFGTNWTFTPSSGENLTSEYGPMTVSVTFTAPIIEDNMYYGGVITIWAVDNHNDYDLIAVNINVANHSTITTPLLRIFEHDPLTIRAEAKEIGDSNRIFSLRVYATNTWDEQIIVHWTIPCCSGVFYLVPNEDDLEVLVYYPYHRNIFQFIPTVIKFGPGEEKLIQKAVFFGISNWILPGLARGYRNYIPSFPWLPDGDYKFRAILNPYQLNNEYKQYTDYISDTAYFHFGAS